MIGLKELVLSATIIGGGMTIPEIDTGKDYNTYPGQERIEKRVKKPKEMHINPSERYVLSLNPEMLGFKLMAPYQNTPQGGADYYSNPTTQLCIQWQQNPPSLEEAQKSLRRIYMGGGIAHGFMTVEWVAEQSKIPNKKIKIDKEDALLYTGTSYGVGSKKDTTFIHHKISSMIKDNISYHIMMSYSYPGTYPKIDEFAGSCDSLYNIVLKGFQVIRQDN